jgi:hypothetical protein
LEEPGQVPAIPQILTIHRAWLLLAEMAASLVFHHGDDSSVYVLGIWSLFQAGWLRRVDARSTAIYWYSALSGGWFLLELLAHLSVGMNGLWSVAFVAIWVAGIFIFRRDMQRYFNTADNVGLGLSPWMTLFFNTFYFQYHFHDIAEFKRRQRRLAETSRSA